MKDNILKYRIVTVDMSFHRTLPQQEQAVHLGDLLCCKNISTNSYPILEIPVFLITEGR